MPKVVFRPDLVTQANNALHTIPTRVLRTEEAATTDAQRQAQMAAQRTNQAIEVVNQLNLPPFARGQLLTQPDGSGGRSELLDLVAGDNDLPHTLGRPVEGFVLVDIQERGDGATYRIPVSRSFDERYVRLHVAHDFSAKIWVW